MRNVYENAHAMRVHVWRRGCGSTRGRDVAVAMLGGAGVLVLLWPTSGQDSNPPKCWNAFGSEVPCEGSSLFPALAVALALFIAMWLDGPAGARRTLTGMTALRREPKFLGSSGCSPTACCRW